MLDMKRNSLFHLSQEVKFYTIADLIKMTGWSEATVQNYSMIQNSRHPILEKQRL